MSTTPPTTLLEGPRRLLVALFVGVGAWYLVWRLGTFNPAAPVLSRAIYAAELFGFGSALLHLFMCWRLTEREAPPPIVLRAVDVFVPTYNESPALVRKTLLAALAMEQPHQVWLLDDGRRDEMAALARELGCRYLTRPDNTHAKAGNLNHALQHSSAELVAVFDCDHAPRRDFLTRTLGYFDDARVAFVQTPQDFYNLDSYQHRRGGRSRSVWTEQSLFFRVIQRGKDRWNAAFFCGSCAVVRREALDEIGGFATGTVTEDLHTSIRLHARGWKSVYHAQALAFGVAPESIAPFIGQRVRWGQGAMHVWRLEGILTHKGLSWPQRLNYLASVLTYFDGWQKVVMYLAPVIVLTTGTMPVLTDTRSFLLHFIPYYALTFWVFEEAGRGYGRSLFIEQYNMARFAAFAWATLAWLFPRMKFRVTAKGGARRGSALRFTAPQWVVMALNLGAIPVGV
ncbi:MAG: glycosyltransferase, partial [Rubrivivax sp.]